MASTEPWSRAVLRWLALSLVLGGAVGVMLSARRPVTRAEFALSVAISMLYSVSIGLPLMVVLHWLVPRLRARPAITQWPVYAVVLFGIAAAGTLVAGLVLVALRRWSLDALWRGYFSGLEIALAVCVPVSLATAAFSRLRVRLVRTEESLYAKERDRQRALGLATEARLASLESRVRPHFLFNALNSAISLIPEDPRRAENLLERLAALLRFSLDAASAMVSLGDELRIVTDYLEIERVRFGERLRYELDVPDALRGAMIPAFAIQTIVENSVKYAVSMRKAGARIAVRARRDAGRLRLEITDDGPGFTGPVWLPGHGLDGLRIRLDALYGPAARLVAPVAVPDGAGAGVTIELPEAA